MTACQQAAASGGGARITLAASYNATSSTTSPTAATAQFELTNGGDIRMTGGSNVVGDVGDWVIPKSGFSLYDCMLTVNSGTAPAGAATATWLNLATTRTWTLSRGPVGTVSNNCTLQIRVSATGIVQASSTITMQADVS